MVISALLDGVDDRDKRVPFLGRVSEINQIQRKGFLPPVESVLSPVF